VLGIAMTFFLLALTLQVILTDQFKVGVAHYRNCSPMPKNNNRACDFVLAMSMYAMTGSFLNAEFKYEAVNLTPQGENSTPCCRDFCIKQELCHYNKSYVL
jgi:hypothetical protein